VRLLTLLYSYYTPSTIAVPLKVSFLNLDLLHSVIEPCIIFRFTTLCYHTTSDFAHEKPSDASVGAQPVKDFMRRTSLRGRIILIPRFSWQKRKVSAALHDSVEDLRDVLAGLNQLGDAMPILLPVFHAQLEAHPIPDGISPEAVLVIMLAKFSMGDILGNNISLGERLVHDAVASKWDLANLTLSSHTVTLSALTGPSGSPCIHFQRVNSQRLAES